MGKKKSGSRSGMNNRDHISEILETIFWDKILNSFVWNRNPEWKKNRIRDPGWKNSDVDPG
jgi:hypothetical protein